MRRRAPRELTDIEHAVLMAAHMGVLTFEVAATFRPHFRSQPRSRYRVMMGNKDVTNIMVRMQRRGLLEVRKSRDGPRVVFIEQLRQEDVGFLWMIGKTPHFTEDD